MSDGVKTRRSYHSPRRRAQAEATRRAILDAAQRLFERQGYAATTIEQVAAEADVSPKTVYVAFTAKSGLLRAVWDLLLKGDQDEAPVDARPWYRELLEEPDPAEQVRLIARNSCAVKRRIAGILKVIRDGAPVDGDTAALWKLIQSDFHANQRVLVESIAAKTALRPGLDIATATDILWTLNHPGTWLLLTDERGWSAERFEDWFREAVHAQLLGYAPGRQC